VNSKCVRIAGANSKNGIHELVFRPVGNERYFLRFSWPDEMPEGEPIDFCLDVAAGILPEEEPVATVTFRETANCRARPSSSHPILSHFEAGDVAEVLGRNLNMTWYEVRSKDGEEVCWVWVKQVDFVGNLDNVPIRAPETVAAPLDEAEETQEPTPTCGPNQQCN
jgi:hypothetical protein